MIFYGTQKGMKKDHERLELQFYSSFLANNEKPKNHFNIKHQNTNFYDIILKNIKSKTLGAVVVKRSRASILDLYIMGEVRGSNPALCLLFQATRRGI